MWVSISRFIYCYAFPVSNLCLFCCFGHSVLYKLVILSTLCSCPSHTTSMFVYPWKLHFHSVFLGSDWIMCVQIALSHNYHVGVCQPLGWKCSQLFIIFSIFRSINPFPLNTVYWLWQHKSLALGKHHLYDSSHALGHDHESRFRSFM